MPKLPKAAWVRPVGDREYHAISAVLFDRAIIFYCRKQVADVAEVTTGEHDSRLRCDGCQGRVIERSRIGIGLRELERSVLWEAEMCDA